MCIQGEEHDGDPGSPLDLHLSAAQDDPPRLSRRQTDRPGSFQPAEALQGRRAADPRHQQHGEKGQTSGGQA